MLLVRTKGEEKSFVYIFISLNSACKVPCGRASERGVSGERARVHSWWDLEPDHTDSKQYVCVCVLRIHNVCNAC